MVNHGLGTAALFLIAGFLIKRRGTALISEMGGIEKVAPVLAGLFLVAGLATLGLPGLSPFVSEFLVLVSAFDYAWYAGAIAVTGIVLAAIYVLWMYQRIMTGPTPACSMSRSTVGLLTSSSGCGKKPKNTSASINGTTATSSRRFRSVTFSASAGVGPVMIRWYIHRT